jgi:outer membrane immunogenic protein
MKRLILSVFLLCLAATGALAKDKHKQIDQGLPPSWNGFYLGGSSTAFLMKGSTNDNTAKEILFDYGDHNSFKGITFGGYEGFNQTHGNFLYGFEAGVEMGGAVDDRLIGTKKIRYKTTMEYQGSARLRVGFVKDNFLAYATGGAAFAQITSEYWSGPKIHRFGSMLQPGWTLGAGVEYKLNQHWSTRLEYDFTDLGIVNLTKVQDPTWLCAHHITEHNVRLGISYQF